MNKLITDLAKLAKVTDVEAFAKALLSETDTDYTLDTSNLIIRTKEEEESFKSNISKDVKDKAFSDAFEIQIKNMKKDLGLEFEGKKSKDFIEAFKSQILDNAKVEPNKRISELETSLELANNKLSEKDSELSGLQLSYKAEKVKLEAENYMPKLSDSIGLSQKEATDFFLSKFEIKEDGIYRGNERQVDAKTATPLGLQDVVTNFVTERGWNTVTPQGRGGDGINKDRGASVVPTTLQEFEASASEKGFNVGGQDYNAYLAEVVKENPEIIK